VNALLSILELRQKFQMRCDRRFILDILLIIDATVQGLHVVHGSTVKTSCSKAIIQAPSIAFPLVIREAAKRNGRLSTLTCVSHKPDHYAAASSIPTGVDLDRVQSAIRRESASTTDTIQYDTEPGEGSVFVAGHA
jgi:hypothetical protein